MRFGITSKLFVAILLTNVLTAVAFGVAVQVSVNLGFREYVREREQRRLHSLASVFATAYLERGSWEFLRDDAAQWRALSRRGFDERPRPPPNEPGHRWGQDGAERDPPDPRAGAMFKAPPPPGKDFKPPPGPPPESGMPLTLLDANREPIAGAMLRVAADTLMEPVIADGSTVGWLALQPPPFAMEDTRFLEEQLKMSWFVAFLALLLAAAVAIPLARGFLAPIRRLARATHRVAAGDYSQHVKPSTRDELGQLVEDFNRLSSALQSVDATRRAFLADVSHELRTPLAILRGELEALQDGVRRLTPEAIHSLQTEVATLSALVDDLQELARGDLGEIVYQKTAVDIASLVRTAVHAFREPFAARALAVDASEVSAAPVVIYADERRIMQVLNNLLENAARYTDRGGRVEIALKPTRHEALLVIDDSAPGVPDELLPRLFERLFRVEASRSREHGGAGLGLSLSKSIVEAHGGHISAHPSRLGGVRIEVRLPRAQ